MIGLPDRSPMPQWPLAASLAALAFAAVAIVPVHAASDSKNQNSKPADSKPQESKTQTSKPAESKPQDGKQTSPQPVAPQAATPAAAAAAAQAAADAAAGAQRKLEIDTARARCTALLATVNAVTIAKDPIEDGSCGDLAPVELVSVGKNPQVAVSPPAILNCDMVVAIHNWMKADVQPLAKKHLGREVVRLETMSSYSCRNAYGRTMSKLSEHGKANALDIRGFATATGQTAYVLDGWGMTSGEIRAAAAAAEKEQAARLLAEKAQAEARNRALAANKAANPSAQQAPSNPLANAGTIIDGIPKPTITFGNGGAKQPTDFGLMQPNKLGGPKKPGDAPADKQPGKPADTKQADKKAGANAIPSKAAAAQGTPTDHNAATATSLFLRAVHESACKRFATTLGPETNAAHRNHFHVDLAQRQTARTICE